MAVEPIKTQQTIVVDANQQIVGRMASKIAKLLLEENHVVVLNVEKSLMSGSRKLIITEYTKRHELKSVVNPINSPHKPRQPDKILYRMIRGMVPRRKSKGQDALKRLKVHIGIPEQYRSVEKMSFEDAKPNKPAQFYVTMAEIATSQGWGRR